MEWLLIPLVFIIIFPIELLYIRIQVESFPKGR